MEIEERVRALLQPVERALEHPAPSGAEEAEITALADQLGIALPADLIGWLRTCRGEPIARGGVFGIRPDDDDLDMVARQPYQLEWLKRGWLEVVASGLWRFLRFLFEDDLRRTGWPFDQPLVLAEDPDLAAAPPELLPWNA